MREASRHRPFQVLAFVLVLTMTGLIQSTPGEAGSSSSTWTEQTPASSPPVYGYTTVANEPTNGDVLLFGGQGDDYYSAETWQWTGRTGHNCRLPLALQVSSETR